MKKMSIFATSLLFSTMSLSSFAVSDQINLTLNGKSVKSIPVDQLDKLKLSINTDKPFKQIFANQMGTLDNALLVVTKPFKKGNPTPDLSKYDGACEIENTYLDKSWINKKSSSKDMFTIAKDAALYRGDTTENIAIGVRLSRKEYTGKTVWSNGGWVKQTRWVAVGPVLGKTVLSLENPTFVKSINWDSIMKDAVDNTNNNEPDVGKYNNPISYAKDIFKGSHSDNYDGSKILSIKKTGDAVYSWNYREDSNLTYVIGKVPTEMNIHAVKKADIGGAESDFKCSNSNVELQKYANKSTFEKSTLYIGSGFDKSCVTPDGKKASEIDTSDITKSDPNKLMQDIMKNLK